MCVYILTKMASQDTLLYLISLNNILKLDPCLYSSKVFHYMMFHNLICPLLMNICTVISTCHHYHAARIILSMMSFQTCGIKFVGYNFINGITGPKDKCIYKLLQNFLLYRFYQFTPCSA